MSALSSTVDVMAFHALRLVYESGASEWRAAQRKHEKTPTLAKPESKDSSVDSPELSHTEQVELAATACNAAVSAEEAASSPPLPGLRAIIDKQLRREVEQGESTRLAGRHRRGSLSGSRTNSHASKPQSPITPLTPTAMLPAAAFTNSLRPESLAATSQVAVELVLGVMDRVVYSPNRAIARYEDALMHFVLNSSLAPTATAAPSGKATPEGSALRAEPLSDDSDLSQQPLSPCGFSCASFPFEDPETENADADAEADGAKEPASSMSQAATALLKERRMLLTRYETCCKVMASMPMSHVLDRLTIGTELAATTTATATSRAVHLAGSLSSSTRRETHGAGSAGASGPPTRGSSLTLPYQHPPPTTATSIAGGSPGGPSTPCDDDAGEEGAATGATVTAAPTAIHSRSASSLTGSSKRHSETAALLRFTQPPQLSSSHASATPAATAARAEEQSDALRHGLHTADFSDCEGLGRPECLIPLLGLLEGYPQATFLGLGGVSLTDAGACVVAVLSEAHLPNLHWLDISRNPLVTDRSAAPLNRLARRHPKLARVDLDGTSLTPPARAAVEVAVAKKAGSASQLLRDQVTPS